MLDQNVPPATADARAALVPQPHLVEVLRRLDQERQTDEVRRRLTDLLLELGLNPHALASYLNVDPAPGLASPPPAQAALNCSIFYTDIAGFGDPRRDDDDRRVVRAALYRILREVFDASNVPWATCRHEDRGDGTLTIVPPTMPTMPLVDPLIALLAAKLKRYNRQAGEPVRMQLRAALHVGPVSTDTAGLCGQSLIDTARMLDAPVLRETLAATRADLAFIASSHVYDTVVRHASGLVDPTAYRRVRINVKESRITGWMYLAGGP
jgi:hypothetical protein